MQPVVCRFKQAVAAKNLGEPRKLSQCLFGKVFFFSKRIFSYKNETKQKQTLQVLFLSSEPLEASCCAQGVKCASQNQLVKNVCVCTEVSPPLHSSSWNHQCKCDFCKVCRQVIVSRCGSSGAGAQSSLTGKTVLHSEYFQFFKSVAFSFFGAILILQFLSSANIDAKKVKFQRIA